MVKKLFYCSAVLSFILCPAAVVQADTLKSVTGTVVETGESITIQTASDSAGLFTCGADIPKFEMTTGLSFAGSVADGQNVMLIYSGEPAGGLAHGEYLLFNPDNPSAADINTQLSLADNGAFLSDNDQYLLYADADTDITDSSGRKAELRSGQYILGWFRENIYKESAVLSKAVILNLFDDTPPAYKQVRITDSGDVLLDDGPIAKLDGFQTAFYRQYHMAPIRPIAEALGYTVRWEPDGTVQIVNEEYTFNFDLNEEYYQINDKFVYFSGNRFIIIRNQTFADYSVINALINKSGPLNFNTAGFIFADYA